MKLAPIQLCFAWLLLATTLLFAETPSAAPEKASPTATPDVNIGERPEGAAPNASLETSDLEGFESAPENVRKLIEDGLALTKKDLTYKYGSADPSQGGMDCSGTIYYLMQQQGIKEPPRTASDQYVWVRKLDRVHPVISAKENTFELDALKPGDLLFWMGTYGVERDPPVTHTMIYLGKEKKTGNRVMVGASDGRTYDGKKRYGVSVFDFKMPAPRADGTQGPRFIGYAPVPFPEESETAKEN